MLNGDSAAAAAAAAPRWSAGCDGSQAQQATAAAAAGRAAVAAASASGAGGPASRRRDCHSAAVTHPLPLVRVSIEMAEWGVSRMIKTLANGQSTGSLQSCLHDGPNHLDSCPCRTHGLSTTTMARITPAGLKNRSPMASRPGHCEVLRGAVEQPRRVLGSAALGGARREFAGELWRTAAAPVESPCCSCEPTRCFMAYSCSPCGESLLQL